MSRTWNVLFLCTGNSARSILAEAILNREGGARFRAFSAGSFPRGEVHPAALELLRELGHPVEGLRSKSWDEFAGEGAPAIDLILTVCDNAAGEPCPVWPGRPLTAHWGIADPAAVEGEGQRAAFLAAYEALKHRIERLLAMPLDGADQAGLGHRLRGIGEGTGRDPAADRKLVRLDGGSLDEIRPALRATGLPADDIRPEVTSFFRLDDADGPLGWAALERCGSEGLLRSVVVPDGRRGRRAGTDLVSRVVQAAADEGMARLWLLTETASPFFARLGFTFSERDSAPPAIRETSEFRHVCPSSASCMSRMLA